MIPAAPILTLDNLAVGYGRQAVLSGINVQFEKAGFYGLLGSNGSGKSTLLKTIAGILPPLSGGLRFGQNKDGRSAVLGYVPQRESLEARFLFSAFEVAVMGVCGRVGAGRRILAGEREFVRRCMEQSECAAFAEQPFSQLSGGQRQRVLIARALATRPDLLLLDEPTAGIDAAATQSIMELLRRIQGEEKIAVILVNHDLPLMRRFVEQVVWLREGAVRCGPVNEMLSREKLEELLQLTLS